MSRRGSTRYPSAIVIRRDEGSRGRNDIDIRLQKD
jgi:hypothetical protein